MFVTAIAAAATLAGAGPATAVTFDTENGISGSFDTSLTFGIGVRTKSPGCGTVIGTVGGAPSSATPAGKAPDGCLDAYSFVNDQGNLNYKKGDVFTTYLKGTHELLLKFPDSWKFFGRVNWIKDFSATHDSGYISGGNETGSNYPGSANSELSFKARLLDFWVSKEFEVNGEQARVRVGNQVISWGESLFLPGGINQTNAMDIMRLSQPGTQLKEVMLPGVIGSLALGLGSGFNLEAYVQADWNANYFPPLGSYWSTATIGPGANHYGSFGAKTHSHSVKEHGQYGVSLRYQPPGSQTNFGFYAMRYHDKSPNLSYDLSTGLARFKYIEDLTLYGLSTNFGLGDWAIGAELSYRPRDAVALSTLWSNNTDGNPCYRSGKCYAEEKKYQFHLTGLLSMTPGDYGGILNLLGGADTATFMAEAVAIRYPNMKKSYDGVPVAAGYWGWGYLNANDVSFTTGAPVSAGTKNSWGYNFDFSWTYDGKIIPGWQVTPEIYFFHAVKGRTPNAMALFMEGAKSANFILTFTQNPAKWVVGLNYAKFWGGKSILDQPLKDRDFVGAYITRNF
jgi:hypothetical protein